MARVRYADAGRRPAATLRAMRTLRNLHAVPVGIDPRARRPAPAAAASLAALLAVLPGCSSSQAPWSAHTTRSTPAPDGLRLQHVVLVELEDPSELAAMRADSDRLIPAIPVVRSYACGTPVDIGRGNVARDYDLGLVVVFDSVEDYRAYLGHPLHEELVAKWRPRWRRASIVDFAP
jgi:hypothetical protein